MQKDNKINRWLHQYEQAHKERQERDRLDREAFNEGLKRLIPSQIILGLFIMTVALLLMIVMTLQMASNLIMVLTGTQP